MDETAKLLWDAREKGFAVSRDDLEHVLDLDAAYEVQCRQCANAGIDIAGWKLGATAEAAMQALGLEEPFMGPVPVHCVYESGATIELHPDHTYFAETEIILEIGSALPPREEPFTAEELGAAITGWRASLEIVGLRIGGGPAGLGPRIIADSAGHRATVMGPALDPDALASGLSVSIDIDGETIAEGGPQNFLWGDMHDALGFIAQRQSRLARPLQAGDILMTGTMTGMTPVKPPTTVTGRFNGLTVTAELV